MAIAYVNKGTYQARSNTNAFVDVNYPSSPSSGNLLIAWVCVNQDKDNTEVALTNSWDTPSGWNLIATDALDVGDDCCIGMFWKFSDGTETGSVNFTQQYTNANRNKFGFMLEYSGTDTTTPVADSTSYSGSNQLFSGTLDPPAATASYDGSCAIFVAGYPLLGVDGSWDSASSGYTFRWTELNPNWAMCWEDNTSVSAGTVDPGTIGVTTSGTYGGRDTYGYTVILNPPIPAGTVPILLIHYMES